MLMFQSDMRLHFILATLLVLVASLVRCERAKNGCDKLERHLEKGLPADTDLTRNYELAMKASVLSFAVNKVAKKWKRVHEAIEGSSCSDSSIEAWLSFGTCLQEAEQARLGATLKKELVQFGEVCRRAILEYLPRQQMETEAAVYPSVRKPLFQFLSDNFLANYRGANADEPPLHIGWSPTGQDCCMPDDRAALAAIESLKAIIQEIDGVDWQTALAAMHDVPRVHQLVAEYLLAPCETYQQMFFHHLYRGLGASAKKFMPSYQLGELVAGYPQDFKDSVFRYQFCFHLKNYQKFANTILAHVLGRPV